MDFPISMPDKEEPVYVLERHPYKPNESRYTIWVKEDGMMISSVELGKLLANVLQSQVKLDK